MEKIAGVRQEDFPADVLFTILVKLPLKQLCRFRCVSKLWRLVIADLLFVDAHHARIAARPEFLMLFHGFKLKPFTCYLDAAGTDLLSPDNRDLAQAYRILVSIQESASQNGGYISRRAGGLYCLCFHDFVRVWSPITAESLDIKTVEAESKSYPVYSIRHFGFDPVEKKHKVLRLEDFREQVWTRKTCVIPGCDLRQMRLCGGTPAGELFFMGGMNLGETPFLVVHSVESNAARMIEVPGLYKD